MYIYLILVNIYRCVSTNITYNGMLKSSQIWSNKKNIMFFFLLVWTKKSLTVFVYGHLYINLHSHLHFYRYEYICITTHTHTHTHLCNPPTTIGRMMSTDDLMYYLFIADCMCACVFTWFGLKSHWVGSWIAYCRYKCERISGEIKTKQKTNQKAARILIKHSCQRSISLSSQHFFVFFLNVISRFLRHSNFS